MSKGYPLFSKEHFKALVIGSHGALGSAFVDAFRSDPNCTFVEAVSRHSGNGFDLLNAQSIHDQATVSSAMGPFEIIVDATGALEINGVGPEKSLNSLNAEHLTQAFLVNAIGPALVLRHFAPLLAKGGSIYAKLSARVGSISDNKKGGWYGYLSIGYCIDRRRDFNQCVHVGVCLPKRLVASVSPILAASYGAQWCLSGIESAVIRRWTPCCF